MVWLVAVLSLLLLATRAAVVVPFALVHNSMPHAERLKRRDILVIWWAGLMRGAVSVALVYLHFDRQEQVGRACGLGGGAWRRSGL